MAPARSIHDIGPKWLTAIGTFVAAAVGVATCVALDSDGEPDAGHNEPVIDSVAYSASPPDVLVDVAGENAPVNDDTQLFIVARPSLPGASPWSPEPPPSTESPSGQEANGGASVAWLTSPPADVESDGSWRASMTLPADGQFEIVAVVAKASVLYPSCEPGVECSPGTTFAPPESPDDYNVVGRSAPQIVTTE